MIDSVTPSTRDTNAKPILFSPGHNMTSIWDKLFANSDLSFEKTDLMQALKRFVDVTKPNSPFQERAWRECVETVKWSLSQNPDIPKKYCRELGWSLNDLTAMMIMQCCAVALTSSEHHIRQGVLSPQGEGFRSVWATCLSALESTNRITAEMAAIETRELDAEIADAHSIV